MFRQFVFVLIALFLLAGCSASSSDSSSIANMSHKTLDMTDLAQVATGQDLAQVQVKVGTQLTYQYYKHSSVGNEADYTSSDEAVCALVSNQSTYNHPENMQSGWTGGDAATGVFTFQALQKGECVIKIQHLFRGELEEEKSLRIIVD